ncbi:MAG: hypothetical protein ABEI97_01760, partial [Candidatus Nanohaloarchaea archaeon]
DEMAAEEGFVRRDIETDDVGMLIRIARHLADDYPDSAVLLIGEKAAVAAVGEDSDRDAREMVGEVAGEVQGDAAFAKGFNLE